MESGAAAADGLGWFQGEMPYHDTKDIGIL